jgi:crossover junction endodeoxyribonuclease RusA
MKRIEFFVPGIPKPAGSKSYMGTSKKGKAILVDSSGAAGKNWRASVQAFARESYQGPPTDAPVGLTVVFRLPRPKYHYSQSKRNGRHVKESFARAYPTTRPDATKLLRAVEDALTGILWRDDSQIISQRVEKRYSEMPGADIWMTEETKQ